MEWGKLESFQIWILLILFKLIPSNWERHFDGLSSRLFFIYFWGKNGWVRVVVVIVCEGWKASFEMEIFLCFGEVSSKLQIHLISWKKKERAVAMSWASEGTENGGRNFDIHTLQLSRWIWNSNFNLFNANLSGFLVHLKIWTVSSAESSSSKRRASQPAESIENHNWSSSSETSTSTSLFSYENEVDFGKKRKSDANEIRILTSE